MEVTKNTIENSLVEPPIINVLDEDHHTVIYKLSGIYTYICAEKKIIIFIYCNFMSNLKTFFFQIKVLEYGPISVKLVMTFLI